ncbi:FG-GAP repeat domain-containing protein [Streptomyces sp. NPDC012508]|uniref:FG-GAP repeat domain-containing protein n=1 Tax=Streptomyces sp. NPDC012508 TaxID=3364837 RepID=UPI0036B2E3A3
MPRSALLRHSIAAVTAATLLAGVGSLAATATAAPAAAVTAAAASTDPWAASVPLTDGTAINGLADLKTAKDGAVVALWYRSAEDHSNNELVVSVRPAGSSAWGAAHVLRTLPGQRSEANLTVSADGSVTAAWMEYPNDGGPGNEKPGGVFRMATLAAGATTWSATTDIMSDPGWVHSGQLAGSPSGELVAVWLGVSEQRSGVYSSVRTAPGAAWSEPVRLDEPTADTGLNSAPELIYSAQGTATVAYVQGGPETGEVKVVDRTAGGTWTEPVTVSKAGTYPTGPTLTLGLGGHAALAWRSTDDPTSGSGTQVLAVRPADSLTWGAEEPANGFRTGAWRKVAINPQGDVTLLGVDFVDGTGYAAQTTTRSAAGTWSALKTISTGYVPDDQFDLTVGPDGTFHAVWTQGNTDNRKLMTSSRVDGAWSTPPTPLSTNTSGYALGLVTVDAAGRPVAVWQQSSGDFTTQLRAATTAPAPVKPLPTWRDYSGDGKGDLLGLTPAGALTVRTGSGTGGLGTGASASGWPATSTVVPFGDLSGDRCNDLLVRSAAGVLTRHDGGCGTAFAPNGPKLTIGSGWNIYDALTAPGDLTGDGRTDLLARTPAGELWMYADDGAGKLKGRVKIGGGWQIFNAVVGVGDLNGDKAGDLLARDTAGVLWRYNGTGTGAFAARTKIGGGWQGYNALAAVGDITGDGKADLVARDTAGALWRYNGTGAGTFAARTKIGGGWQMYKTLS